jgi:glycosyltransferase involved in cell wall biosynthesis
MTIYLTVTNDLSYDQRMIRICTSLSQAGYNVVLVGRKLKDSPALQPGLFKQKRIGCQFQKGKLFYAEYNLRLFFYLLFKKMDCLCSIDLDTILPCLFISNIKKIKRVYDAHELFCEMKEIVSRPAIHNMWKMIENFAVPKFLSGYTVNQPIADEFNKMYDVHYQVIRNTPVLETFKEVPERGKYILYQGAVNEGRCFETLIPAMKEVDCKLFICGDGNFMKQAQTLVIQNGLEDKVIFKGNIPPDKLRSITRQASIGINLVENNGMSNYLSLANKFFDYIHAGIPQLCSGFPAYREINDQAEVALLITDMQPKNIALKLNNLLHNEVVYGRLRNNCIKAREIYNWQNEEKTLLAFYKHLIG